MGDIKMTAENFEAMINEIKEGNLETILKIKNIMEDNFNTLQNNSKNFEIGDSKKLKKIENDYSKVQNILSEYKKSIDDYWEFVKETYLPIIRNNEESMSN